MLYPKKLKTNIKSRISFEKVRSVFKSNQNSWQKPYTDIDTGLGKKHKMILKNLECSEKVSFSL